MKTLCAYYDLAIGPVSYDVIPFLVRAALMAQDANCRLQVVILPDPNGVAGLFRDKRNLYDEHEMRWRLWNLVIPACQLAGASVMLAATREQGLAVAADVRWPDDWDRQTLDKKPYLFGWLIQNAARPGFKRKIPLLRASEHALRKVRGWYASLRDPVVTLTVRNTYEVERNSNLREWQALANALADAGKAVVWITDTDIALGRGYGYGELNIDLRLACYQLAQQNIIGNNGPAQLLWFSEAPFMEFDAAMPFKFWRKFWENNGLMVNDQLPWARQDQRLYYQAAIAENMIAASRAIGLI